MVLYFTGTGNSEYAAKKIAAELDDSCVNLFEKLKNKDYSEMNSDTPWVIVAPTYAWQLPRIVSEWLEKAILKGNKKVYIVLTCGDSIYAAGHFAKKIIEAKGMIYGGTSMIIMPENYIAVFNVPDEDEARLIVMNAEEKLDYTSAVIGTDGILEDEGKGLDVLKSKLLNSFWYTFAVKDKKFAALDRCNGCGTCAEKCVKGNIKIVDGRPVWQGDCTHCMACICYCPMETIEYGTASAGKPRYKCPVKL